MASCSESVSGAAAGCEADFEASAAHLAGDRADRIILADLAILEFGDPDILHAFGFEDPDIFVADHVALRQQFLPPGSKNG